MLCCVVLCHVLLTSIQVEGWIYLGSNPRWDRVRVTVKEKEEEEKERKREVK